MKRGRFVLSDGITRLAGALLGGKSGALEVGGWLFGDVTAAGQGELKVTCDGLPLELEDLRVPPELDYKWTQDSGAANLLRRGDKLVLLVEAERQSYYILKKAVWQ